MPRLSPYVVAKGAALVFRRRIPAKINHTESPLRLTVALRTRDPREASRRAAMLNALAEVAWVMELPDDQVRDLLRVLVARVDALGPTMPPFARTEAERRIQEEVRRAFAGLPHLLDDPTFLASLEVEPPTAAEEAYVAALERGEIPYGENEEPAATTFTLQPSPKPAGQASDAPKRTSHSRRKPQGEHKPARSKPALRSGDPDGWLVFAGRYIDRQLAGFLCEEPDEIADPAVGKRFKGGSWGNYQSAMRMWADAVGNRSVRDYTPQDAREFHKLLAQAPASKGDRRKPIREAIAEADAKERAAKVEIEASGASRGAKDIAKEKAHVPRLTTATIDRYVGNLRQVFAWAVVSGLLPENPFAGVGLSKRAKAAKKATEPGSARRAWTPSELRTLFAWRSDNPAEPLFWAPRIGVATGSRMADILELRGSDFREDGEGGWLVAFAARGQGKNKQARRDVPLHSGLIEAGLLRLVEAADDGYLFPDLQRDARGRLSGPFSKIFGRHRKRLKLTARGLDFHGFRGTANAAMEAKGATLTVRQAVCGWKSDALADTDYLRDGPNWHGRREAVEHIPLREWFGAAQDAPLAA